MWHNAMIISSVGPKLQQLLSLHLQDFACHQMQKDRMHDHLTWFQQLLCTTDDILMLQQAPDARLSAHADKSKTRFSWLTLAVQRKACIQPGLLNKTVQC